ncbi:hypothetical protein JNL27_06845 [bacterium]|nr:hypothetical protein [bacterium]
MKSICSSLILFSMTGNLLFCQTDLEQSIRADNVTQPEVYQFKFNSAGSVDYHGDYTAQIPLMAVPGRGGLDQPITLTYKSGIATDQRATWVGLGWNLNPGTITRVINGLPDVLSGNLQNTTGFTESGAIEHIFDMYGNGFEFPDHDHYDNFLVNIPGVISGLLIPTERDNDTTYRCPDYVFQEWNGWSVTMRIDTFSRVNTSKYGSTTTDLQRCY